MTFGELEVVSHLRDHDVESQATTTTKSYTLKKTQKIIQELFASQKKNSNNVLGWFYFTDSINIMKIHESIINI